MTCRLPACALLTAFAGAAHAQAGLELADALMGALNAPTGTYSGLLQGRMADYLRNALHTNSPLFVDVSTVRALPEEGCKRLRARITAPAAQISAGMATPATPSQMNVEINLCANRRPPIHPMPEMADSSGAFGPDPMRSSK